MSLGLYIHIPYCLQKCHYCDFTTFSMEHRLSMKDYVNLLLTELRNRHEFLPSKQLRSIYFGGGTPSLLPTEDILTLLQELNNLGFTKLPNLEITLEINPGTIDQQRLDQYLSAGINRFSLGVQTFDQKLLKASNREHSAEDSLKDLTLLNKNNVNYTMDLLFGLPNQDTSGLKNDLQQTLEFAPPHVSAYCLTVPETHFMNRDRASDDEQNKMYELIESELAKVGILRYELSNYAKVGFESQHNLTYWNDLAYWGIGISAHSYLPTAGEYGARFWNSTNSKEYESEAVSENFKRESFWSELPSSRLEILKTHEALTDFCHTQLRKITGLSLKDFDKKFPNQLRELLNERAALAQKLGLADVSSHSIVLTKKGRFLANKSFLQFTFLPEDLVS